MSDGDRTKTDKRTNGQTDKRLNAGLKRRDVGALDRVDRLFSAAKPRSLLGRTARKGSVVPTAATSTASTSRLAIVTQVLICTWPLVALRFL